VLVGAGLIVRGIIRATGSASLRPEFDLNVSLLLAFTSSVLPLLWMQVRRCLWISLTSAPLVAVIAILQSLQLLGVTSFLQTYYRGSR
jgi:hypothetical protein